MFSNSLLRVALALLWLTDSRRVCRRFPRGGEVQRDGEGGPDQQPHGHRAHPHEAVPSPEEPVHRRLRLVALPVSLTPSLAAAAAAAASGSLRPPSPPVSPGFFSASAVLFACRRYSAAFIERVLMAGLGLTQVAASSGDAAVPASLAHGLQRSLQEAGRGRQRRRQEVHGGQ